MTNMNDPEKVESAVKAFRNSFNGGGCVIALFPLNDEEWGMSVAMSHNTPTQVLEQLSDALVMGKFQFQVEEQPEGDE